MLHLCEQLIGKGYELVIYDSNVQMSRLLGANREYILNHIPHIGRLLVERPERLFEECDVIVVACADPDFERLLQAVPKGKRIVDLGRTSSGSRAGHGFSGVL